MRSLLVALALLGSVASAAPVVQDMTCAQARAFVAAHGMYYVYTEMAGDLPIYGVHPDDGYNRCERREYMSADIRPTRDVQDCYLGYTCQRRTVH